MSKFSGSTGSPRRSRVLPGVVALLLAAASTAGLVQVMSPVPAAADVVTNSDDTARTGWDGSESKLSPSTVGGPDFGQLYSAAVTGQVYAQPLVSANVLLVATEHNDIYGLNPATGAQLWTRNVGTPYDASTLLGCGDLRPTVGITSTPVVDQATGTAYVMSKAYPAGSTQVGHFLHALDVQTGAERSGFPVQIQGPADNDPSVVFGADKELQRPGLLLMNGVVYAGFSGHCDAKPFQGWVVGVSTTTATITSRWSDEVGPNVQSADGPGGGIWQSGSGLMSDASGDIVVTTGNGTPSPNGPGTTIPGTLGQSLVRLRVQPDGTLKAVDHFSPYDASVLNQTDSDVGSGGPVALPPQYFGTPAHPRLIVNVGKQGYLWLTDAANLGGVGQGPLGADNVVSRVGPIDGGVWGKPAVWPGDGGYVYLTSAQSGGGTGRLKAYRYSLDGSGNPTLAYAGQSPDLFGFSSSSPMVTSSGTTSGTALVWTVWSPDGTGVGGQLRAYDAVPVNGQMVLRYSQPIGTASKFLIPSSDGGKVFVGTRDGRVLAFGSPVQAPLDGPSVSFQRTTVGASSVATATVTAGAALTVTGVSSNNPAITVTGVTPQTPATLAAGGTLQVALRFAPTAAGAAAAALSFTTSAGPASISVTANGQSPGPVLTQFPCCLSFGGVVAGGDPKSNTVTFGNDGAAPLTINSYTMPAAPFTVTGLPPAGSQIASGASFSATFTFAPQSNGLFTDQFAIATNDPTATGDNGAAGGVSLAGTGGTAPVMRLTPQQLEYGSVPVGTTATQTFTITNTGSTDLTITISKPPVLGLGFTAASQLDESTLIKAGTSVQERVNFTPTAVGGVTDTWAITGNDGADRQQVAFHGTGVAAAPPTVSIADLDVNRPTTGSQVVNVPVTLSTPAAGPVTVQYSTKDGTAVAGSGDYTPTSGTLTFAAGDTVKTIPVTVNGASVTPVAETLTVNLGAVSGAALADASAKLYLTGTYLPVGISVDDVVAPAAGSGATSLVFPVTVRPAPYPGQPVTVKYATADGTAVAANGDYVPVSDTLTFTSAAPTQNVTVPVSNVPASGSKTVLLNLSNASNGSNISDTSATGTAYNGAAPLPQLYITDSAVVRSPDGPVNAVFTVRLSRPTTSSTVPFTYAASPGSLAASEFDVTQGNLTFNPGETTKTVTLPVHGSATSVGTGTINMNLSRQSGASLGDAGGKVYVVSPLVHAFVSVRPTTVWRSPYEETTAYVPITLDSASRTPVTVTAATADGTALAGTDYFATSTTAVLPPGTTSYLLPVTIRPSTAVSPSSTFSVKLSGAAGSTQLSSSTALVTLVSHSSDTSVPPAQSAPTLTGDTPPATAMVGSAYTYTFAANGTPDPSFALTSGTLPPGLALSARTGALQGTPTTTGIYTFVVSASNTVGAPAVSPSLTITVSAAQAAPSFTAASPPTAATAGDAVSYTFTASGNPAPTYSVSSGSLPPGLGLDPTTGALTGSVSTPGNYSYAVSASNGVGSPAVTPTLTFTVSAATAAPVLTAASPPSTAVVGSAYNYTFTATGSPAPTFSLGSGALPQGLSLSAAGLLSGTPTATGTSVFTVTATNGVGSPSTSNQLSINVSAAPAAPQFTAATPPTSATVGVSYSYAFSASGSPDPTYQVASGTLPTGLTLGSATGLLTGTPTTAGTFSFTVQASNGVGSAATTGPITVTVAAAGSASDLAVTITGPASIRLGSNLTYSLNIANTGPARATNIVGTLTLPPGATFVSATPAVSVVNGQVTWTQAALSKGSAIHWKLTVTPTATGTYTTRGSASSATADPNSANNTASLGVLVK